MFDHLLREIRKLEGTNRIPVKIEVDNNGYIDRQCSSNGCAAHFKVMLEDWRDIVRDESVYCPHCRYESTSSDWNTLEQREYHANIARGHVQNRIGKALQSDARAFNSRQRKDSFIGINMSYRPGNMPIPIPAAATALMTQEFRCPECNCRYSSIGAAFFCPSCGHGNVVGTFFNSIETVKRNLVAVPSLRETLTDTHDENVAEDSIRHLRENGLCKTIASFQKYAESCFFRLSNSNQFNVRRNLFQNLGESNHIWRNATNVGYTDILTAAEYHVLNIYFQQRHLLEHQEGIVDQQYIDHAKDSRYSIGQRLVVTDASVFELVSVIEKLSKALSTLI